jgi:hypothetical protein
MSNKKYFNQPIEINNSGDLTVVSLSSSTSTEYLVAVDGNGKFIKTEIENVQEDFDLIDFIELTSINEDDVSLVIPAKYRITSIVIEEVSGSSAGNISIGTTTSGTDVVNSETVGANALVDCALGDTIFSKTTSNVLYISSSSWGSGGIDISIRIEKFTE